mmetsp:Transcript_56756/g.65028  ORF Transcript_56756/g.65028 Transcript_56756/m.65028 type:complete len:334 (-) Transcript_56756:149-1150(-)
MERTKSKSKDRLPKQEKVSKKDKIEVEEETQPEEQVPQVVAKDPYGFEVRMANKWYNKQRILLLCSRGVSSLHRHLYSDIFALLPHAKKESKVEKKELSSQIPELCELNSCNNFAFFETRKKKDLYLWLGKNPHGPSAKFLVETITTTEELRMTGNCLKGSRPLLSFDQEFDSRMHYKLMKQLLIEAFGTPNHHPKSKPFHDHMFSFTIANEKIFFRHYQIVCPSDEKDVSDAELVEIGPRFSLNLIKIFDGTMSGLVLYENQLYESPNTIRKNLKRAQFEEKAKKIGVKRKRKDEMAKLTFPKNEINEIFADNYDLYGEDGEEFEMDEEDDD